MSGVTTATTATVTVSMNGKTAKKSAAVQQAANAFDYSDQTKIFEVKIDEVSREIAGPINLPAKGVAEDGSISIKFGVKVYAQFTSGSTAFLFNDLDDQTSNDILHDWGPAPFVDTSNAPTWENRGSLVEMSTIDNTRLLYFTYGVPENQSDNSDYSWLFGVDGIASHVLEKDEIFQAAGGSKTFTITSNSDWTIS